MIHQNNIILKYLLMTLLTMISSIYLVETNIPMYDVLTLSISVSIFYALLDRVLPSIYSSEQN
jgi:hypothetical protein